MSESQRLLEQIETFITEHGGDLGGWTRLSDDSLQLFDGRVTLRVEFFDPGSIGDRGVHAHVYTTVHEYDDEVLDACIFGVGDNRDRALGEAALIWCTGVAGPIRSFLDNKPLCMTCQAGVSGGDASQGYVEGDYGLTGLRAFVGPSFARAFDDAQTQAALNDSAPWFRFAAESAAPRRIHLAKASVFAKGKAGWSRDLEVDGHDVSYHEEDWAPGARAPDVGYLVRFAVFEFPRNSAEIRRRAEIERAIRFFAEHYGKGGSIDELMDAMIAAGFDADVAAEIESISTIAFGRVLFEGAGVQYSPTIIRARRDGRIETDVPLMSLPAYTRARALSVKFRETMSPDDFQALCLYNAESQAIVKALEEGGDKLDLSQLRMFPCVVPDRGVSQATMDAALAKFSETIERNRPPKKKPWWKFW